MKVSFEDEAFVIFDDVLPVEQQRYVWNHFQSLDFEMMHKHKWLKAFRLEDGEALRSHVYISRKYEPDNLSVVYPTQTVFDNVFNFINEQADYISKWIGKQDKDWLYYYMRPYLYKKGTGLSWHRDNHKAATGAYVYYAHPKWDMQWGGEMIIANYDVHDFLTPDEEVAPGEFKSIGQHLTYDKLNEMVMGTGMGHYVMPKPNRLVIIKAGYLHAIRKVDDAAGNNVRASLQGFFLNPQ